MSLSRRVFLYVPDRVPLTECRSQIFAVCSLLDVVPLHTFLILLKSHVPACFFMDRVTGFTVLAFTLKSERKGEGCFSESWDPGFLH